MSSVYTVNVYGKAILVSVTQLSLLCEDTVQRGHCLFRSCYIWLISCFPGLAGRVV